MIIFDENSIFSKATEKLLKPLKKEIFTQFAMWPRVKVR